MKRNRWTEREESLIRARYANEGAQVCADELGVKRARVKYIAGELGISTTRETRRALLVKAAKQTISIRVYKPKAPKPVKLKADGTPRKPMPSLGSPVLEIAWPLVESECGCSSYELREACHAAGVDMLDNGAYKALKHRFDLGHLVMRWRMTDRKMVPFGAEAVFFANPAHAEASGLYMTRDEIVRINADARAAQKAEQDRRKLEHQKARRAALAAKKPKRDYSVVNAPASVPASVRIGKASEPVEIDYSRAKVTVFAPPPGRFEHRGPVVGGFATAGVGRYLDEVSA